MRERGLAAALATSSVRDEPSRAWSASVSWSCSTPPSSTRTSSITNPAPDVYLVAADHLDIEPARCVAVEDSFNGVRSGAAAGMRTIMVPDYNEPTPEIRALCAEVLTTLHELPAALDRLKTPNV